MLICLGAAIDPRWLQRDRQRRHRTMFVASVLNMPCALAVVQKSKFHWLGQAVLQACVLCTARSRHRQEEPVVAMGDVGILPRMERGVTLEL